MRHSIILLGQNQKQFKCYSFISNENKNNHKNVGRIKRKLILNRLKLLLYMFIIIIISTPRYNHIHFFIFLCNLYSNVIYNTDIDMCYNNSLFILGNSCICSNIYKITSVVELQFTTHSIIIE